MVIKDMNVLRRCFMIFKLIFFKMTKGNIRLVQNFVPSGLPYLTCCASWHASAASCMPMVILNVGFFEVYPVVPWILIY